MSDFQALALFIFALMLLSAYILNQFYNWQIQDALSRRKDINLHEQKLNFNPKQTFEQLAWKRLGLNDPIRSTSRIIEIEELTNSPGSNNVTQYYKHKIDYKE